MSAEAHVRPTQEHNARNFESRYTLCFSSWSFIWAPSSEFVSSNIPSWQILTAHAQPFGGARDLALCLKVPLDTLPVWASSEGSGETARMRRLAWTFAARIGDKYQIRLTRSIFNHHSPKYCRMWNSIVSVPDHCLFIYFSGLLKTESVFCMH